MLATTLQKKIDYIARLLSMGFLVKMSSIIKGSLIIGSQTLFFSASSIVVPVLGAYAGVANSLAVALLRLLFVGMVGAKGLALVVPGFFASLYWNTQHWLVRLAVPVVCFALFVTHPVGMYAAPYAFYWFIPMILYFTPNKNIFLTALASTFTAHAVGSVIWLYTVPMSAAAWLALIPLVAVERLCFSVGMVVVYKAIGLLDSFVSERLSSKALLGADHQNNIC
ncbi:MAG TPA: hypothetical protein VGT41_02500 [Candidatus Babeliales bacterium]|nr:hypothetical protein [Candidatus Babeliales bacterium]